MRYLTFAILLIGTGARAATLSTGSATPSHGTTNQLFKLYVTFTDAAPPQQVRVNIDGAYFSMTTTDTTPADGSKYTYSTKLGISADCYHYYYFEAVAANGTTLRYPTTGTKKGAKTGPPVTSLAVAPTNPLNNVVVPNNTTYLKAQVYPSASCDAYQARFYYLKNGWTSWKYKTMSQSSSAASYDTYRATLYSGYDRASWDINPGDSLQYFFEITQNDGTSKRFASPSPTPYWLHIGEGGVYDGVAFNDKEKANALAALNQAGFSQLAALPFAARIAAFDRRAWSDVNDYSDYKLPDGTCSVTGTSISALRTIAATWTTTWVSPDRISSILASPQAYGNKVVTMEHLRVVERPADGAYVLRVSDGDGPASPSSALVVRVGTGDGPVPAEIVRASQEAYDSATGIWLRATVVLDTTSTGTQVWLKGLAPTTCWTEPWGRKNGRSLVPACGTKEICGDFIDQDCDGQDLVCGKIEITNIAGVSVAAGQKYACKSTSPSTFSVTAKGTALQSAWLEWESRQALSFDAAGALVGSINPLGYTAVTVSVYYRTNTEPMRDEVTLLFNRTAPYCDCWNRGPTTEVCNGIDDNCDGVVDEGC